MARFFGLLAITSLGLGFGGVIPPGSILNILSPAIFLILAVFAYWRRHVDSGVAEANLLICMAWTLCLGASLFLGGSYLFLGQPAMEPRLFWPIEAVLLFFAGVAISYTHAFRREIVTELDHAKEIQRLHEYYREEDKYRQRDIDSLRRQLEYLEQREKDRRALYAGDHARIAPSSSYSHSRRY